ncbi:MAG TPA: ergothioneine biosynthesis protein EgtB [Thermoanaerobaculia bacterium]|jgi:ergothioneine biosynthesis protein EgtB|nr:ergothioneine biosynthesis protein EgtB [Thermoanaerobaculia bacterium]
MKSTLEELETRDAATAGPLGEDLAARYRAVRGTTDWLTAPLSPEDATVQSMPDASPAKWHLAHTSWFFETFVLAEAVPGYRPFHPDFRVLFNSYYNTLGAQHPRAERGLVTRPGLDEVRAYRAHVDRHLLALLAGGIAPALAELVEIGLQHEQQHQELILTDFKYLLSRNPLRPVYRESAPRPAAAGPYPLAFRRFEEGIRWIGHAGPGFAFDNEGPRHRVFLDAFEIASRPVTNGEILAFIADGGYARPELWLSDGWNAARSEGWRAPLYWTERDGSWTIHTLSGERALDLDETACHLSFYEADAYARWAGARLPTEAEWEVATIGLPLAGNFLEDGLFHPAPSPTATAGGGELVQMFGMFGDIWEWTASPYTAYPGYHPPEGALGEYNGKFMVNQIVLRGGSCATPRSHIRATYRNFFPPGARWQWSGLRLARD